MTASDYYTEKLDFSELGKVAAMLQVDDKNLLRVCEIAGLKEGLDYKEQPGRSEVFMTSEALQILSTFLHAAKRSWMVLGHQMKLRKRVKTCVTIQSLLRSHQAKASELRVSKAVHLMRGVLSLIQSCCFTAGPKRRAAIRLQSFWRMTVYRRAFSVKLAAWRKEHSALRVQKVWRGSIGRKRATVVRGTKKVEDAINYIQRCCRSFLAARILFASAIERRRKRSADLIRRAWLALKARQMLQSLQSLKFMAVHAKYVVSALTQAHGIISRNWRGFAERRRFAGVVNRINAARAAVRLRFREQREVVKLQAWCRGCLIRKQFLLLRRVTIAVQARLKTTLAIRRFKGLPL